MSLTRNKYYDVRAAHLKGCALTLGIVRSNHEYLFKYRPIHSMLAGLAKKALFYPDLETGWNFETLPTVSDVLAIQQTDVGLFL